MAGTLYQVCVQSGNSAGESPFSDPGVGRTDKTEDINGKWSVYMCETINHKQIMIKNTFVATVIMMDVVKK